MKELTCTCCGKTSKYGSSCLAATRVVSCNKCSATIPNPDYKTGMKYGP